MNKLLKNSLKVLLLLSSFCVITYGSEQKNDDIITSSEKIELVYNISPLINKRDNAREVERTNTLYKINKKKLINNKEIVDIISTKLGVKYGWGRVGPNRFDCSGFVWKVFNEYNIGFQRSTAREYWKKFNKVDNKNSYRFGNLVFFSNLKHVGIVVDENGFYHASSSKGITYSKFNTYWKSRIYGFKSIVN